MSPPNLITGQVMHGDGQGRALGFPTANLDITDPRPPAGIYACWARLDETTYQAVVHVGPRPTFPGATNTIEVHLLDFPDRDLYGQSMSFFYVEKIRDIEAFNSLSDLSKAIAQDCKKARRILTDKTTQF